MHAQPAMHSPSLLLHISVAITDVMMAVLVLSQNLTLNFKPFDLIAIVIFCQMSERVCEVRRETKRAYYSP